MDHHVVNASPRAPPLPPAPTDPAPPPCVAVPALHPCLKKKYRRRCTVRPRCLKNETERRPEPLLPLYPQTTTLTLARLRPSGPLWSNRVAESSTAIPGPASDLSTPARPRFSGPAPAGEIAPRPSPSALGAGIARHASPPVSPTRRAALPASRVRLPVGRPEPASHRTGPRQPPQSRAPNPPSAFATPATHGSAAVPRPAGRPNPRWSSAAPPWTVRYYAEALLRPPRWSSSATGRRVRPHLPECTARPARLAPAQKRPDVAPRPRSCAEPSSGPGPADWPPRRSPPPGPQTRPLAARQTPPALALPTKRTGLRRICIRITNAAEGSLSANHSF